MNTMKINHFSKQFYKESKKFIDKILPNHIVGEVSWGSGNFIDIRAVESDLFNGHELWDSDREIVVVGCKESCSMTLDDIEDLMSYRIGESKRRKKMKLLWHNNQNHKWRISSEEAFRLAVESQTMSLAVTYIEQIGLKYGITKCIEGNIKILEAFSREHLEQTRIIKNMDLSTLYKDEQVGRMNIGRCYIFEKTPGFDLTYWKLMKGRTTEIGYIELGKAKDLLKKARDFNEELVDIVGEVETDDIKPTYKKYHWGGWSCYIEAETLDFTEQRKMFLDWAWPLYRKKADDLIELMEKIKKLMVE